LFSKTSFPKTEFSKIGGEQIVKTLIISDNKRLAVRLYEILSGIFMGTNCTMIKISDLAHGRSDLLSFKPRLVILDIDPQEDIDMAGYIVKLAPRYSVPIIAVTMQGGMKYTMISAGAVDVLTFRTDLEGEKRFVRMLAGSIETIQKAISENKVKNIAVSSKIIAIGGSTGSTNALPVILQGLKTDCPPIVCVLHMPEGYTKIYAEQLNSSLPLEVKEAAGGMYVRQGQVIIAAGSKHLRVFKDKKGYFITSEGGVKVGGHCPSVNVLFDSVAYAAKSNAIGVILTGMGRDGADGMLNMRKMGAFNIAQDEATSVVYGMPKAAYEEGAAQISCPLDKIAERIMRKVNEKEKIK
jgi:two-component system chemotaxis response regulator CheB